MNDSAPRPKRRWLTVVACLALLAAVGAALYFIPGALRNAPDGDGTAAGNAISLPSAAATGQMAAFVLHKKPQDVPAFAFQDGEGREYTLADWRGKTVLVNLWATWCAPCREEMPALANLRKTFAGRDFDVVAISLDQKGVPAAKAFLDEIKVSDLVPYADPTTEALRSLNSAGLPTTVLIDAQGKEIGRLLGSAVWDSPEAVRLIEATLAQGAPPGGKPQS
ncbi:TlpA family protein disulfide reductase [Rhodoligotrophos defluvii]|uniref:TlpA family protein disulfide reductase n=1 Tax=Rhodoligotrophos defluvii TaxID=2561934 RepID=UPI0010CA0028|nr:TlpA disulfide reductase family protein [Rhodoligotrophos defluvii]